MQRHLAANNLPEQPLDAATAFMAFYLPEARSIMADPQTTAIAIILPPADHSHRDWRRALARYLAREYAPKRANVLAASGGNPLAQMLQFLSDAPGVTGHYCEAHE